MPTFIDQMNAQAKAQSTANCGHYVRMGLAAAGVELGGYGTPGGGFRPLLTSKGASVVASAPGGSGNSPENYQPQPGDVAVFEPTGAHISGHIEVWNGSKWVSDFTQNAYTPYTNQGVTSRATTPPSTIYRFPGR
jgi:hypothetical protein